MIQLSKRLQMVADLVPKSEIAADVGTDHGYLAVWLLQNGRADRVFATDIHKGPLSRARQTAAEYGLREQIETHLCDGLQFPGAKRTETVVIAGMGGETMISILSAAPWTKQGMTLILQPQSKRPELEQWLYENGYTITDAKLCLDAGKLYLAIEVHGKPSEKSLSAEVFLLRNHDSLFSQFLSQEMQKMEYALKGMEQAERDLSELQSQLQQRLELLRHYQKEVAAW